MLDIRIRNIDSLLVNETILKKIKEYESKIVIKNKLINQYGLFIKKIVSSHKLPEIHKDKIERRNHYDLNDFLKYYDEEFIANCYLGLLHREPDIVGFEQYLNKLRSGELHKIEILGRVAFSKEARARKVKVPGLKFRFLIRMLYRVPIIGYILNMVVIVIKLPKIINHQAHVENKIMEKINATKLFSHHEAYLNEMAINEVIKGSNLNNDILMEGLSKLIQELTEKETGCKEGKRTLEDE